MKHLLIALQLLCALPVSAQEEEAPSLMDRGAQMFLEGLLQEVEPRVQDLQEMARRVGPAMADFFQQMGPALTELIERVEDWSVYEVPEMLPNGDIIIRRKEPLPPDPMPAPENPVEL